MKRRMDSSEILERLRRVGELRVSARATGVSGWSGEGSGSVTVESPSAEAVVFLEEGKWLTGVGFRNVYRWSLTSSRGVRLEHLRLGPDRPVHLVDFAPESESLWNSVDPHRCGDDSYSARLELREDSVALSWSIAGPRKEQTIDLRYGWEAPKIIR
ncbi:MAG: DUF6314 family protein [Thermoanaerobaculia bacterium]